MNKKKNTIYYTLCVCVYMTLSVQAKVSKSPIMRKPASNEKQNLDLTQSILKLSRLNFLNVLYHMKDDFFVDKSKSQKNESHFNILNGFNDTLQTEVKIFC